MQRSNVLRRQICSGNFHYAGTPSTMTEYSSRGGDLMFHCMIVLTETTYKAAEGEERCKGKNRNFTWHQLGCKD